MIYYKENGDKVNIKKGTSLGRSVYKIYDDKCIKIGIDPRNVSLNTLILIRELDLKGIYKIYDILCSFKNFDISFSLILFWQCGHPFPLK